MIRLASDTFVAMAHATLAGFHDRFGNDAVLMRLSAVGFSPDTAHAVVATDTWSDAGTVDSELHYLVRSTKGRWSVAQRSALYIDQ
jgi:hypothetical protein